jgi:hypothetical protein
MKTPPESLKGFCDRIADAAVSTDGAELARLLRLAGLLGETFQPVGGPADPTDPAGAVRRETAGADRVGIWERASGEPHFARRMDRVQEWNYWANLGRIEAKGSKRRVVLIGESVARGYLYDPLFTPAGVLQAILERRMGGEVEVIDLARTDLGFEVGELAKSALLLEPDAVVIFSGNNWNVSAPPLAGRALTDSVLRAEGIAGLKRFAETQLAARVHHLVREVSSVYRAAGVPLVWLVPEFNLGDWRDPFTNAPHLPGTGNRDWLEAWQAARQAFDGSDLAMATAQAQRMVEIDQGVCVAGLYLLAECQLRSGDAEAARRSLERARDAVIWDTSRNIAPRAYGVAQEALRDEAAAQGSLLVDLPQVFREHLGSALPDRRVFIDYCHLTAAGMQVAMAAAASPVLRVLTGTEAPWRDLVDGSLAPSGEVEAHAAFLAAVHNAHWWQSREVVRHYCSVAAQASPSIVEVMGRFLEIQTRRTPMLMSQAAEEIAALASRQLQYYLLRYNYQQLDRVLIDAITDALLEIDVDPREPLAELRREEHSLARKPVDLLDYYYCSAALQPQEAMWVLPREVSVRETRSDFYRAYWIESRFLFIAEAGRPVRLGLTCRLPRGAGARGELILALNDRPQAAIEIGDVWETWDVEVPGEAVREGLNEVSLRWPLPDSPGERALEGVFDDPDDRAQSELFPCFGEIHAFTAAAGSGW